MLGRANADEAPASGVPSSAGVDVALGTIPAGTHVRFHVTEPLSSEQSKTGQLFNFVLLDPIRNEAGDIVPSGAVGSGTLYLAGHAGNQGHEGDLTLRLDWIRAADNRFVTFADQRFEVNGRNRKIASTVLGLVPYAGFGALFIHGSAARLEPNTPVETVLLRPASIGLESPPPKM